MRREWIECDVGDHAELRERFLHGLDGALRQTIRIPRFFAVKRFRFRGRYGK
jgi:hypothetical protein